jgi:sodium/hydrogen antiporter
VLGLAVCAYASAVAIHGNGFIAAFAGGLMFGTTGGRRGEPLVPFVEETGALVSVLVWLAFGAVALVPAMKTLTWAMVLYAILSLTVIRMVPVVVALVGAGLGWATVVVVAWFGPRGLASVVFALLALEELGSPAADRAVAVIAITVLLSVVAHGATAEPLAAWYAKLLAHRAASGPGALTPDMPDRRLIRRSSPPKG